MIKTGTSGFSFPDWRGTVYPKDLQPKEAFGYYLSEFKFDCVEINSTYYALVSTKSFESMEKKTKPGFEFVVKGYKGVTHDPFDPRLGSGKPGRSKAMEDMGKFMYSLKPLADSGKLGAVLLQFPVFFAPGPEARAYIIECREKTGSAPLVVEFRNEKWAAPDTFEFLRKNGIAYCAVDEPKLPRLMPFMNEVTAPPAYLRLHGRNKDWFNAPASRRYDYLYSDKELKEFVPEAKKMDAKAGRTYVFFNNCHAGSAVRNAMSFRELLGEKIFLLDRDTNVSYNRAGGIIMKELTDRQRQVLDLMERYSAEAGAAPTVREVASGLGVSIGPAQRHIKALVAKGYLRHRAGVSRGTDLSSRAPQAAVPILGRVPAGSPVPPLEDIEGHVHVDRHFVGKGNYFALKVRGDSMTGAGILDGDIVVVRQQQAAEHGEIVVALAGGEATVKRLHRKGRELWLQPENPKYKPIHSSDIRIAGKVVYLTRKI